MDIILTHGPEKLQLPASMIYIPLYQKNLETFLRDLKYDIDLLKFTVAQIKDNEISSSTTYSSQKIEERLAEISH